MSKALLVQPTQDQLVIYQAGIYLEHVANTKSSSTLATYTDKISVFTRWWHDNPMTKPLQSHLEAFKSYVGMKYGSARSKNLMLSVVRNLFRYLYEVGILEADHAKHLKNFKVSNGHTKNALDKYQLHSFLEHLNECSLRDRALFTLAISNGLRVNEIACIEIADFDQRDGDEVIWLKRKGYESKDNYTILTPETHSLLMEYRADRTEGHLFTSQKGGGLSASSISKLAKKTLRAVGIDSKSITMHSMRHTFGRLCAEADVSIAHVMEAMNHKHMSSTQVYYRAYDRSNNAAEKAINIYG